MFSIFLSTDNTLVFANAALDYILCLLSHIRNVSPDDVVAETSSPMATTLAKEKKDIKNPVKVQDLPLFDKEMEFTTKASIGPMDLCRESLKLLENCVALLSVMYNMPKCPTFNLMHRINIDTDPQLVDPIIQNMEVIPFQQEPPDQMNYKILSTKIDMEYCEKANITLQAMDKQSGVLKVCTHSRILFYCLV